MEWLVCMMWQIKCNWVFIVMLNCKKILIWFIVEFVVNNDLHIVICMVVGAGVVKERNIFTSNENNLGLCKFQLHWLGLSKSSWWEWRVSWWYFSP